MRKRFLAFFVLTMLIITLSACDNNSAEIADENTTDIVNTEQITENEPSTDLYLSDEENQAVLDSIGDTIGLHITVDDFKKRIIEQTIIMDEWIDRHFGWGREYFEGVDEFGRSYQDILDLWEPEYNYMDSLVEMMETGAASEGHATWGEDPNYYTLEMQAAQLRYCAFYQIKWINVSESPALYDCLYNWFRQGHFSVYSIVQLRLENIIDQNMSFDGNDIFIKAKLVSYSIDGQSIPEGETYVAYLSPVIDGNGVQEWAVLDIFNEELMADLPERDEYRSGVWDDIIYDPDGFVPQNPKPGVDYTAFINNGDGTWTDPATGYWYYDNGYGPYNPNYGASN